MMQVDLGEAFAPVEVIPPANGLIIQNTMVNKNELLWWNKTGVLTDSWIGIPQYGILLIDTPIFLMHKQNFTNQFIDVEEA